MGPLGPPTSPQAHKPTGAICFPIYPMCPCAHVPCSRLGPQLYNYKAPGPGTKSMQAQLPPRKGGKGSAPPRAVSGPLQADGSSYTPTHHPAQRQATYTTVPPLRKQEPPPARAGGCKLRKTAPQTRMELHPAEPECLRASSLAWAYGPRPLPVGHMGSPWAP